MTRTRAPTSGWSHPLDQRGGPPRAAGPARRRSPRRQRRWPGAPPHRGAAPSSAITTPMAPGLGHDRQRHRAHRDVHLTARPSAGAGARETLALAQHPEPGVGDDESAGDLERVERDSEGVQHQGPEQRERREDEEGVQPHPQGLAANLALRERLGHPGVGRDDEHRVGDRDQCAERSDEDGGHDASSVWSGDHGRHEGRSRGRCGGVSLVRGGHQRADDGEGDSDETDRGEVRRCATRSRLSGGVHPGFLCSTCSLLERSQKFDRLRQGSAPPAKNMQFCPSRRTTGSTDRGTSTSAVASTGRGTADGRVREERRGRRRHRAVDDHEKARRMNTNINTDPNRDNPYQEGPLQEGTSPAGQPRGPLRRDRRPPLAAAGLVTALVLGLGGSTNANASARRTTSRPAATSPRRSSRRRPPRQHQRQPDASPAVAPRRRSGCSRPSSAAAQLLERPDQRRRQPRAAPGDHLPRARRRPAADRSAHAGDAVRAEPDAGPGQQPDGGQH